VIYLQQKRYDDAIAMFRQALSNQMAPRDEERRNVILNLHKALQEKGDIQSAEAIYKQYLAEVDKEK
jgi:tetratricopeptide (TPR) repeat protein